MINMISIKKVMHMSNIREPIKKSSIEKKNKIIEKGFELMCEQGYHNVNCVDIAKYAEVSTGIIYQYFKNKHFYPLNKISFKSSIVIFSIPFNSFSSHNFDNEFVFFTLAFILSGFFAELIPYLSLKTIFI